MAQSKLVEKNEKIAERVVDGYKKIENGVVGTYQKIEEGVVGGFTKMEQSVVNGFTKVTDKFVDQFLTREGESVEDAKKRLAQEQAAREGQRGQKAHPQRDTQEGRED